MATHAKRHEVTLHVFLAKSSIVHVVDVNRSTRVKTRPTPLAMIGKAGLAFSSPCIGLYVVAVFFGECHNKEDPGKACLPGPPI
jgi:hypothetical protein